MSGDVQPRKRKDKKRKKDDLGVDEPRGTAAALGEGDVFMHSHHDHGTGGHWCAKVIFFSLLFVLVGLIGLIILENRGLSELEANAVQSQYSGVLEGWLEDAPEDDHHDEHTLELNNHDDEHDEVEHSEEAGDDHDDDEEHGDHDDDEDHDDEPQEDEDDEEDTQGDDEEENEDGSQEQDLEDNDEEEDLPYRKYYHGNEAEPDDDEDDRDDAEDDRDDDEHDENNEEDNISKNDDEDVTFFKNDVEDNDEQDNNVSKYDDDEQDEQLNDEFDQTDDDNANDEENNQSIQQDDEGDSNEQNDEDEEEHEDEEEDTSLEVEKIEKEALEDEEPISNELPALPEQDDDDDDGDKKQDSAEDDADDAEDGDDKDADDADDGDDDADEADDFLEADDDEPPVERITAPSGKPFDEVEEPSTEKPTDTLEEEEEYEKRQEQLRKEEAEASHMWLKLSIGGALLVATHAIVRRATASSDVARSEEQTSREATPAIDRRMTLIPEEPSELVPIKRVSQESSRPVIQEMTKQIPSITREAPTFEESEEEVEEEEEEEPVVCKVVRPAQALKEERKELYSDEEEAEEDVEEEEPVKKVVPVAAKPPKEPTPEPEEDVPDDVEIIDDEQIEEEEEAEDEEEISDVDDEELLTRLEAKYGRLAEPERPARRKDGGNSIEDWPGEPADAYWRSQLDEAEREYNQGANLAAADRAGAPQLKTSARARWFLAKALDAEAEKKRDNVLLGRAIAAYLELLKMNERLSDKKLLEIAERVINRIQFRGTYLSAEPVYRLLMRRFPNELSHRANLTVTYLMANRGDLAEDLLKETLKRWPNDRLSLAQYGFILKTQHNRLEEALDHLQRALEGDTGPATEPRFYYHLGDTLLLLGRFEEAHEVHKRGAAHGHFLSPAQRSLYNVPGLEGRPWWNIEDTPYVRLARDLENNWKAILKEGEAAKALYEQEKEGLKERGEWSQLDLFVRGREIDGRCARAPVTCAVVRREISAAGCRRGQIKFSSMAAGTHVRPHVGPTNCRLRMHLGLSNTQGTFIRVHRETRQWETGKVFMFDDSFEHEVWHNGTGSRLVLIVDVWHPALTATQRRQLPAI